MSDERENNQPFNAVACSKVARGHVAVIRPFKDDAGADQIEFMYVGPIVNSGINPAGLTVIMHPEDMTAMAMIERNQLGKLN